MLPIHYTPINEAVTLVEVRGIEPLPKHLF